MSDVQTQAMVGAYTTFSCDISKEAQAVFEKATANMLGVKYTPVAVSTQVVEGTNYAFFVNVEPVAPVSLRYAAIMVIYQPLEGEPHITEIKRV